MKCGGGDCTLLPEGPYTLITGCRSDETSSAGQEYSALTEAILKTLNSVDAEATITNR
jgi:hypothetical protein